MAHWKVLGELERRIMEQLWESSQPQTVRDVHARVSAQRDLAYTTVMTVLRRLTDKGLLVQYRDDRAHRYAPVFSCDELVAGLMVDALDQVADSVDRRAALVYFVESVGADDVNALACALADLEMKHAVSS